MATMAALTLAKELLLQIFYYEDGHYEFYTKGQEFYADSDNDYPYCPNLLPG